MLENIFVQCLEICLRQKIPRNGFELHPSSRTSGIYSTNYKTSMLYSHWLDVSTHAQECMICYTSISMVYYLEFSSRTNGHGNAPRNQADFICYTQLYAVLLYTRIIAQFSEQTTFLLYLSKKSSLIHVWRTYKFFVQQEVVLSQFCV